MNLFCSCDVYVCADIFNVCDLVYCGKGTCHLSSSDLLGFRCDCDSGWKKPNIGSFQLPPCALPNCESCIILIILTLMLTLKN